MHAASLEARARAYLHVNCGHCHRAAAAARRSSTCSSTCRSTSTSLLGSRPTQGTFGILGAQIVAPGDPYRSVLYYRMSKLGHGRMPQFGSQVVDPQGHEADSRLDRVAAAQPAADDQLAATDASRQGESGGCIGAAGSPASDAVEPLDRQLLASPSGALELCRCNRDRPAYATAAASVPSTAGPRSADPAIRDLFERFVPEERRVKRLGSAVRPAEILALAGDAERGRAACARNRWRAVQELPPDR